MTVFFLISGFLLYRPFVAARLRGARPARAPAPYAWRRFLRIVPAYWLALTVVGARGSGRAACSPPAGIPTFYGLAQIYRETTIGGGLTQAWTLCIEVAFYAFLPLWGAGCMRFLPLASGRALRSEWLGCWPSWRSARSGRSSCSPRRSRPGPDHAGR